MQFSIEYLLYFYLLICGALLLFNIFYILAGGGRKRLQDKRKVWWRQELAARLKSGEPQRRHSLLLEKKLRHISQLIAFCSAAEELEALKPEPICAYFQEEGITFQSLCAWYGRRDSMERAYFAWFAARFKPYRPKQHVFRQLLISYLENATVYCRENVLKALYLSGDLEAVETALQFMNDKEIFHHPKLIADGLAGFTGDREALGARLWRHRKNWSSALITAVVQFLTGCSAGFCREMLEVIRDRNADREIRMAGLRYLRRYPYEPARASIQSLALNQEDADMAVVAAFALDHYPGEDTVSVLKKALASRSWYVRSNAAASLFHLGIGEQVLHELQGGGDRYALDMMHYQLQRLGRKEKAV